MKVKSTTSLGIDISEDRISVALVRHTSSGLRLLKADQIEMPDGAFDDGAVVGHSLIGSAIRKLLRKNHIATRKAVVSLCAKPILTQVIELPDDIPDNMNQFVRSEIRHSPVLAGTQPQFDYCRLSNPDKDIADKIFVAASDIEKVSDILKVCSVAGVDPVVLEIPVLSALRAVHFRKVANRYDTNVLVIFLHGTVMTTSVFRRDEMDFVRTTDLADLIGDANACLDRCCKEVRAVIQYYDIEVDSAPDKWDILAVGESSSIERSDLEFVLQKNFGVSASVVTSQDIYSCSPVAANDKIDKCSITAVGLAMRNLPCNHTIPAINLVPQAAKDASDTRKFALVTANFAALALLLIIALAGIVRVKVGRTQERMEQRARTNPENSIERLLLKQRRMNSQITYLTDKKARMKQVFAGDKMHNWPEILEDIRKNVPSSLYITGLAMTEDDDLMIEGNATSFKSIHVFAELLTGSSYFRSAVVGRTEKSTSVNGLVTYSIACVLTQYPQGS
jgi:Tfp pilus assembly protein PilN